MTTTGYLGWDPYTIVAMIGGRYVGTVNTGIENKFVEKEYVSDTYSGMPPRPLSIIALTTSEALLSVPFAFAALASFINIMQMTCQSERERR